MSKKPIVKKSVVKSTKAYYVYRHIRLDFNTPFYIGKGSTERAWSKDRSPYWHNVVNKAGYRVEIIIKDLEESNAFQKEIEFIKFYRGLGYKLVNLTEGGESPVRFNSDEAEEVAFLVLSPSDQDKAIKEKLNYLLFQSFKKDGEDSWNYWQTITSAIQCHPSCPIYQKLFNKVKHLDLKHLQHDSEMKQKHGDLWP